jgi:3-hydroxyisobutyrate dehydrogenase-like beta-hydroxyacid dehydrogenase
MYYVRGSFNSGVLDMPRKIGFVGVGLMGRGMARNLIRKGHSVTIYNRNRQKAEEVAQIGGQIVDSPAEAAQGAEVVVTMLADPTALLNVSEGPNGILSAIRPGAILIDSSTVSPTTTLRIAEALKARGAHMIDAPVFGSKNEAERGELGFIIGAERAIFDSVADVFACMGKTFYVGGNGSGIHAKLVVNLIIAVTLQAMNEGIVLAAKGGIDPDIMVQIIQSSRARSGIIEMKSPQVLKRDFSPFFPLRLMDKDLGLVLDTARSVGVPLFLTSVLKQIYEACMLDGLADEDYCATVKFVEKLANVEVESRGPKEAEGT